MSRRPTTSHGVVHTRSVEPAASPLLVVLGLVVRLVLIVLFLDVVTRRTGGSGGWK